MRKKALALLASIMLVGALISPSIIAAPSSGLQTFCEKKPTHPRCQISPSPSPTPSPTASPTPSPTPLPTPTPTVSPTPVITPTPSPTPVPTATPSPSPTSCPTSLQIAINTAAIGSTLDLSGCSFTGPVIIDKALTIIGAKISVSGTSTKAITVKANNVTLDGLTISGGRDGIWAESPSNLVVKNSTITDVIYSGIMYLSAVGGLIENNYITRVGVGQPNGTNAYGIAISNYTGAVSSQDVVVRGNTVTDVPTWHAYDTHGGQRITFENNISLRASRAFFITSDSAGKSPADVIVRNNLAGNPSPVTYNLNAITLYSTIRSVITNNAISAGYGCPVATNYTNCVYDYLGASTNKTIYGNYIGETLPQ